LIDQQVVRIWDQWCPSPVVENHGHVGESLVVVVEIPDGHPWVVGAAWLRCIKISQVQIEKHPLTLYKGEYKHP